MNPTLLPVDRTPYGNNLGRVGGRVGGREGVREGGRGEDKEDRKILSKAAAKKGKDYSGTSKQETLWG